MNTVMNDDTYMRDDRENGMRSHSIVCDYYNPGVQREHYCRSDEHYYRPDEHYYRPDGQQIDISNSGFQYDNGYSDRMNKLYNLFRKFAELIS